MIYIRKGANSHEEDPLPAILAGALCLTALTACGGSTTVSAAADSSGTTAGDSDKVDHRWRYPDPARRDPERGKGRTRG